MHARTFFKSAGLSKILLGIRSAVFSVIFQGGLIVTGGALFFGSLMFFGISATSEASETRPFRIVLDAGHGGIDTGTVHDGFQESGLTFELAKRLERMLKSSEKYQVSLTRTAPNQTLELSHRSKMTNATSPDLLISLHANSSPSPKVSGADIYIFGQMAGDEEAMFLAHQENLADGESQNERANERASDRTALEEKTAALPADVQVLLRDMVHTFHTHLSYEFAKSMKSQWEKDLASHKVHIRQAPFHVLANVRCPSILIEVGYISNPAELAWLKRDESISAIARTIKKGLDFALEKSDKNVPASDTVEHDKLQF